MSAMLRKTAPVFTCCRACDKRTYRKPIVRRLERRIARKREKRSWLREADDQ